MSRIARQAPLPPLPQPRRAIHRAYLLGRSWGRVNGGSGFEPKVPGMHRLIEAILIDQGVITTADHPRLRSSLGRLARQGVLSAPLPGVFVPAHDDSATTWLRAVSAWSGPTGVLHGRSAAGIWLPDVAGPVAFLAHPTLRSRRGVVVCRRVVPPEFVLTAGGIRMASPAYCAVELAATDDGRAICEALRLRLADPVTLRAALSALTGAAGTGRRRDVVAACADNPWSYAELRLHRILRSGGISGWVANGLLSIAGVTVFPDVRFRARRLILEFDGRGSHEAAAQFLQDRERQNLLEAAGYHVLRFGWSHLDQPDYILTLVRQALASAAPVGRG